MSPAGSTSAPHHLGIVMSAKGRFVECINCRLRLEFLVGVEYDTIDKQFESYPCAVAQPKLDDSPK